MIEGLQVIDLVTHEDDRGYLTEIVRNAEDSLPHGLVHQFGQVFLVGTPVRGTVRGFHKHLEMWDWFFINHGAAKFVLVDDREESPTKGELVTVIATARRPQLIMVPPGIQHGIMALEDDTQFVCTTSHTYSHENPDEVRIPADSFGDVWTVKAR